MGRANEVGDVVFELNGSPDDQDSGSVRLGERSACREADEGDEAHVAAAMPGPLHHALTSAFVVNC
jgi:hypothetical protein